MTTHSLHLQNRLTYFDCLSGIAFALTQRNAKKITDEEYALLREAMQEISLLALHGTFIENDREITQSVDDYLNKKLGALGQKFIDSRNQEVRLKLDIALLLREQLLDIIGLLTKIALTLKGIITTPPLDKYDITLIQACLIEIKRLKDVYSLVNCYPTEGVLPAELKSKENDLSKLLALRHKPRKARTEDFQIEKIQTFLLHKLIQVSSTLQCFLGDLKSLIPPPAKEMEEANSTAIKSTEILTDLLEKSLETDKEKGKSHYPKTVPILLNGLNTISELLEKLYAAVSVANKNHAASPASLYTNTDIALKADKSWTLYRQNQLKSVAKNLIGIKD